MINPLWLRSCRRPRPRAARFPTVCSHAHRSGLTAWRFMDATGFLPSQELYLTGYDKLNVLCILTGSTRLLHSSLALSHLPCPCPVCPAPVPFPSACHTDRWLAGVHERRWLQAASGAGGLTRGRATFVAAVGLRHHCGCGLPLPPAMLRDRNFGRRAESPPPFGGDSILRSGLRYAERRHAALAPPQWLRAAA